MAEQGHTVDFQHGSGLHGSQGSDQECRSLGRVDMFERRQDLIRFLAVADTGPRCPGRRPGVNPVPGGRGHRTDPHGRRPARHDPVGLQPHRRPPRARGILCSWQSRVDNSPHGCVIGLIGGDWSCSELQGQPTSTQHSEARKDDTSVTFGRKRPNPMRVGAFAAVRKVGNLLVVGSLAASVHPPRGELKDARKSQQVRKTARVV